MYGVRRPCASCGSGGGNFNLTSSNWGYNSLNNYSPSYDFNNYRYSSPIRATPNYSYNENVSYNPRPITSYQNRFSIGNNYNNYRINNFQRNDNSYSPYRSSNQYNVRPMSGIYDNYSRGLQNNNYYNLSTNGSSDDGACPHCGQNHSRYRNVSADPNVFRNSYMNTNMALNNTTNNFSLSTSNYNYSNNNYNNSDYYGNAFTPQRNVYNFNNNNNLNTYSSDRFNSSQQPYKTFSNLKTINNNYSNNNYSNDNYSNNNYSNNNYSNNNYSNNNYSNNNNSNNNNLNNNNLNNNYSNINYLNNNFSNSTNSYNKNNSFNNYNNFSNSYNNMNFNNSNNRYSSNSSGEITLGYYDFANGIRQLIDQRKSFFLLMFGTFDYRGVSWCSDCNFAEPLIKNGKNIVFSRQSQKPILWVNVPIEKEKRQAYRVDAYLRMMYVPTLIYFENGIEMRRIVQEQMFTQESINNFILRAYQQNYY